MRRSPPRSATCSPRSPPTGSAYGVAGGVRRAPVPAPRLRRGVGRAAAVGPAHPRPRCRDLAQPGLRRGVRVRAAPLPPGRAPGRVGALLGHRAAPRPVGGADPRPSPRLHHLGGLPGQRGEAGRQPHQRRGPPAAGGHRAVPGHRVLRRLRPVHAGPLPGPAAPLRMRPFPRRPRRHPAAAGRCGPTRSMPWSPPRCWRRSPRTRSPWRWPPLARSPTGAAGRCGPPSWPSNVPAMTPTALSGPSWPASRRTGWSPAPWRPGGRPG